MVSQSGFFSPSTKLKSLPFELQLSQSVHRSEGVFHGNFPSFFFLLCSDALCVTSEVQDFERGSLGISPRCSSCASSREVHHRAPVVTDFLQRSASLFSLFRTKSENVSFLRTRQRVVRSRRDVGISRDLCQFLHFCLFRPLSCFSLFLKSLSFFYVS